MGISSLAACHISLFWLSHRLFALWWINFSLSLCLSLSAERAASNVLSNGLAWDRLGASRTIELRRSVQFVCCEHAFTAASLLGNCTTNSTGRVPRGRQPTTLTVRPRTTSWLSLQNSLSLYAVYQFTSLTFRLTLEQCLTDWLNVFIMTSDKPQMKLQCMYK